MTEPPRWRSLAVAAVTAVAVLAALAVGATSVAVAQAQPDPDCAGSGGGAVYVTDSGLTVYENDSAVAFGTFPDNETVSFQGGAVALSASGSAEARLERAGDASTATCVGDLDATTTPVTVQRGEGPPVTLSGSYASVSVATVDYLNRDRADLAYNASEPPSVTIPADGLTEDAVVRAHDATTGERLAATLVSDGTVTFSDLPAGRAVVDLRSSPPDVLPRTVESNTPVTEGETVSVSASLRNYGLSPTTESVTLSVAGEQRDTATVELAPNTTRAVTLTWTTGDGDAGEYDAVVAAGGRTASTPVEVIADDTAIDVAILSTNAPVRAGDTLTVTAAAENVGTGPETRTVALSVGSVTRDTTEVELATGERTEVTLSWDTTDGDAGDYTASVGDATTRVTVDPANTTIVTAAAALSPPADELSSVEVLRTIEAYNDERPLEGTDITPGVREVLLVIEAFNDGGQVSSVTVGDDPRSVDGDAQTPVEARTCMDCPLVLRAVGPSMATAGR